ncbi:MAG TPA: SUMF1/EgtB/PvdO family nonheme iron enzyme [Bacteroidia bacterium]|jgi:formylglycine-generating enzyme required for sulfatase activity|nr:SUMF1/EgtB/PvdO family nonheme iron enzyme [Bacteroidia bacterium]
MKNSIKIFFIPFCILLFSGFASHKPDTVRKQPKSILVPPGTVWLRDSLFIDQCEIRNLDYLEFLYWLQRTGDTLYTSMLPDTIDENRKFVLQEPYVEYYLRHPAYRNYPVVGVSYDQAVAYCNWRTKMVNRYIYIQKHKELYKLDNWDTIKNYPAVVRYRLPTKEEWEYAAAAGLNAGMYPLGYEEYNIKTGRPVSVTFEYDENAKPDCYRRLTDKERKQGKLYYYLEDKAAPVMYGKPNRYGIYNLTGNVSEIIQDSIVKGYNFKTYIDGLYGGDDGLFQFKYPDSLRDAYYKNDIRYNGPQMWLGFRCVCEILRTN